MDSNIYYAFLWNVLDNVCFCNFIKSPRQLPHSPKILLKDFFVTPLFPGGECSLRGGNRGKPHHDRLYQAGKFISTIVKSTVA